MTMEVGNQIAIMEVERYDALVGVVKQISTKLLDLEETFTPAQKAAFDEIAKNVETFHAFAAGVKFARPAEANEVPNGQKA